jgi:hypothetical protein
MQPNPAKIGTPIGTLAVGFNKKSPLNHGLNCC